MTEDTNTVDVTDTVTATVEPTTDIVEPTTAIVEPTPETTTPVGIIAHLEAFGEWTEEELIKAKNWIEEKL